MTKQCWKSSRFHMPGGMSTQDFKQIAEGLARYRQASASPCGLIPRCVYQPMLELLAYLRASGFKTFIVSAGGVEFIRPWSERSLWHPARTGHRQHIKTNSRSGTASR